MAKNTEHATFRNHFSPKLSSVLPPQLLKAENFVAFKVSDFVPEALGAQDGTTPQMASFPFCKQTGPLEAGFGVTPEGFPGWNV